MNSAHRLIEKGSTAEMISFRGKNRSSVEECRLWNFLIAFNPRKKFTKVSPEIEEKFLSRAGHVKSQTDGTCTVPQGPNAIRHLEVIP